MIDHIGIVVRDYARSKAFYEQALAPLGSGLIMESTWHETGDAKHAGFGANGQPQFWIGSGVPRQGPLHVAFAARTRAQVDAFYQAAIAAGGTDNGPPGLRPQYHPNYYGAFVLDPDGVNIEAVCHLPL